ncbi:hypothetical protein PTI98_009091 [Pleurotus ostreatus]|uniref:Uncharacterized protein n=1 Tax=Pleurotus ostreatus (strain PC15) TaxID=1137138 RepID=A0A067NWC4_PLEO1|nr:hypothetical protein PTI98_009091 [Pleurotus ostreatus]KDQ32338.1 hypothetical protein PLEOSDRAFT_1111133 [Pleurotus ostreatus PC15]
MQVNEESNTTPGRLSWLAVVKNNTDSPGLPSLPQTSSTKTLRSLEHKDWLKYVTTNDNKPRTNRPSHRNKENKPMAASIKKSGEYLCLAKAVRRCKKVARPSG